MLVKKLFTLFCILLIVQLPICYIFNRQIPAFWGNTILYNKIDYLKKHNEFNTVFIGSSKTENQINTFVFDSTTNHQTTSFNLGCSGIIMPETMQIANYVIDNTNIKYIIFEARCSYHINPPNLNITRTIYCENPKDYAITTKVAYNANLPLMRKLSILSSHSITFIDYIFNFSLFQGYVYFITNKLKGNYSFTRGFEEPKQITLPELLNEPQILIDRKNIATKYIDQYNSGVQLNCNLYLKKEFENLQRKAEEKNKKVIFMLASSMREFEYIEVIPVLKQLNKKNVMLMSDGIKFPELYELQNNREPDHLNKSGTVFFSRYLGEQFCQLKN